MRKPHDLKIIWRYRAPFIGFGIAATLLHILAAGYPKLVEEHFSEGLYPGIAQFLGLAAQLVPVSLFEVLILTFSCVVVLEFFRAVVKLVRGQRSLRNLIARGLVRSITWVSCLAAFFILAWGLNYHRQSISSKLGYLESEAERPEVLVGLANELAARMEQERLKLDTELGGVDYILALAPGIADVMDQRLGAPESKYGWSAPRTLLSSSLAGHANIWGIYSPFTNEANVNASIPRAALPFITVHEVAHQRGWAREVDANVYAFFACESSHATLFRYSAYLRGWQYTINAINGSDATLLDSVGSFDEAGLFTPLNSSEALRSDLREIDDYQKAHRGIARDVQVASNDLFLKANGQSAGVKSYGMMVTALIQWYQSQLLAFE